MFEFTPVTPYLTYFFIIFLVYIGLTLNRLPFERRFRLDFIALAMYNGYSFLSCADLSQAQNIQFNSITKYTIISLGLMVGDILIRYTVRYVRERKF